MMKVLLVVILVVSQAVCRKPGYYKYYYSGYQARPGDFPFTALLQMITHKNGVGTCGGALISPSYVLTAAHCTDSFRMVHVYLGMTDITDTEGVAFYNVSRSRIYVHPEYNGKTSENDISLIPLPTQVSLSSQINVIALPSYTWAGPNSFVGYHLTLTGFGQTYNYEYTPHKTLQYTSLPVMPYHICEEIFEYTQFKIKPGMMCTAVGEWKNKPCAGDSGGPLTVKFGEHCFLVGLNSFGSEACEDRVPNVFTDVAFFVPWISSITDIPVY